MRQDKAEKFMQLAQQLAHIFSKDRSTKVGALMVNPLDFTQLTQGYNGMPRGVDESIDERHERPLKYSLMEHAERNMLYNLARERLKGSIAITTTTPSLSCVRALLSVGASQIWWPRFEGQSAQAHAEQSLALQLCAEVGVQVHFWAKGAAAEVLLEHEDERHARKMRHFISFALTLPEVLGKDPHGSATLFLDAQDYTRLTDGYSGLPRGADEAKSERYLGELRHMWVESSVRNAIYNSLRGLLKGSTAIVTATTCVECARALAAVGVAEVIYREPDEGFKERWAESIEAALQVLRELGIKVQELPRG